MAEVTKKLEMRLAGGVCDDLYPWNFVLDEGFSRLYRGELTAISDKKHTAAELAGLVDKGVSVTMRETLEDKKTVRSRSFHGIVTFAACSGVFCSAALKDCYTYTLVIEPELARLRYTRFSAPYYRMNPADIFEKILGTYKIKLQIKDNYLARGKFGKNLMFDQTGTPALDFIEQIAAMYGISYTFTHPEVSGGGLGDAELYFSDGERFPVSPVAYSDKRTEPDTLEFDFLAADEGKSLWKMDDFHAGGGIGVDGVKLIAMYPNANYGSDQWKQGSTGAGAQYVNYNGLFHGYDKSVSTDEVDADIKLILAARMRAAAQAKARMSGGAANIALRPGAILNLGHFYGKEDRTVNAVLVTGIRLKQKTRWREDLAVRPGGAGGEMSEVRFECIDWGKDAEKRFCPPTTNDGTV
jgi:uncharacterized protein involved in type VI secretion and phage assembly